MTGCSDSGNSVKEPTEAAADPSPAVAEIEEPQEPDSGQTSNNNPIDEYFCSEYNPGISARQRYGDFRTTINMCGKKSLKT